MLNTGTGAAPPFSSSTGQTWPLKGLNNTIFAPDHSAVLSHRGEPLSELRTVGRTAALNCTIIVPRCTGKQLRHTPYNSWPRNNLVFNIVVSLAISKK